LMAPLALSAAPLMCSRSIVFSTLTSVPYMLGGERRKISTVPDATRLTDIASQAASGSHCITCMGAFSQRGEGEGCGQWLGNSFTRHQKSGFSAVGTGSRPMLK
jgi:hypothetical protein